MGEQLQKVSMKWSAATLQHEAELLDAFAGLVEGRSQLSRVTMKIAWRLVRTVGILRVIEEFVQDKPCETAPALVAQSLTADFPSVPRQESQPLGPKPLRRIQASEGTGASQRKFRSVSQRRAVGAGVRLAWLCPPFRATSSPLKSNSFRRVA